VSAAILRRGVDVDITFYLFFTALLVSFAAWCIFLWAIRTDQFRDVEDIKYQVWPDPGETAEKGDFARTGATGTAPAESAVTR
jgi:cbb3-type cytochrome oxidase maturation protein